ncbi:hypothetical protein J3P71_09365 [Rhizobium leguminosarum]|uniref:hypothetical protein n=1 Tax=Rhizobium leguminosarum TaxID=384 RepID=UPI0014410872|nr:hypothetical protein [Rhizobium leguminosarum]MBY5837089.1 hypothetical protein [Rhizobium leguminosarum]NKM77633.1 hypothetical protein [Rhizobium leguminosarum bv. viciae]QSZ09939.1 hypothetical protein J3P71_09365 [Rhizobium leguminosarum]
MKFYIAALTFLVSASSASAQSAEETVAYIMIGAEDGTSTQVFGGASWKMTLSWKGVARYFIRDENQVEEINIQKVSDCQYLYEQSLFYLKPTRKIFKASQYELNFRNAREYDISNEQPDGNGFIFRMKGLDFQCHPHPDHPDAISCDNQIGFINAGDANRARGALKYFKEKFCPGKAF